MGTFDGDEEDRDSIDTLTIEAHLNAQEEEDQRDEELEPDEMDLFDTPPSSGGPILRPKQSKKLSETSSWSIASTMASTYADVTSMADTITNDEEDFRVMRSVSIASQGAYSDATEINGALENLDHAIEEFEGDETSSNCSSKLTVRRKASSSVVSSATSAATIVKPPPPSIPVQIIVHEPPPKQSTPDRSQQESLEQSDHDDTEDEEERICQEISMHEGNFPPAPAALVSAICNWKDTGKKDSGYGSQGILKFDSAALSAGKSIELGRNTPSPTAIVPKDEKDLHQYYDRINLNH